MQCPNVGIAPHFNECPNRICDQKQCILHYSRIPGTAALVQISKGPIGSNAGEIHGEISRTRWGQAISQERKVVVFEDPATRRRFRSKNFIVVKLPGGVSFFTMLGIETTAIPRSVKLRPDDVNTQVIVQLGEMYKDSQAELFLQPIEGLQPYGTEKNARMIVTAADGTVLRLDGDTTGSLSKSRRLRVD
jgi:hypothetical protein